MAIGTMPVLLMMIMVMPMGADAKVRWMPQPLCRGPSRDAARRVGCHAAATNFLIAGFWYRSD